MARGDSFKLPVDIEVGKEDAVREFNRFIQAGKDDIDEIANYINSRWGKPTEKDLVFVSKWNDQGFKEYTAELKESESLTDILTRKNRDLEKVHRDSVTSLRQQVNEAKQVRDGIAKTAIAAGDLENKVSATNPAWDLQNQKVAALTRELNIASASNFWEKIKAELGLTGFEKVGRAVNDLVNTFQSLSIIIGQVTAPINELFKVLNNIQQFSLTFDAIGLSAADATQAFTDATAIALNYGTNLESVRDGFIKLTPTIIEAGGSMDNVAEIIDALSSRFVAFGLSGEQSNRVMNAIVQAFGKGKLMAEELTQQISEADPAFRVNFATALGVSVAKLNEMIKAGEVTNDVLIKTLPQLKVSSEYFGNLGKSAGDAADALDRGEATIQQVQNQIKTLNTLSFQAIAQKSEEFLNSVLGLQGSFTDLFTTISSSPALETLSNVFASIVDGIGLAVDAINGLVTVFNTLLGPIFEIINRIDEWGKSFLGFQPIATAIGVLIGVTMLGQFASFLKTLGETGIIKSFFNILSESAGAGTTALKTAFNGLKDIPGNLTTLFNGLAGIISGLGGKIGDFTGSVITQGGKIGEAAKGITSSLVNAATEGAGKLIDKVTAFAGLTPVYTDLDNSNKKTGTGFLGLGKSAKDGGDLTSNSTKAAAGSIAAYEAAMASASTGAGGLMAATRGLVASIGVLLAELAPLLAIIGLIAGAMYVYDQSTKVSKAANEGFKDSVEDLKLALEANKNALGDTESGVAAFNITLSNLRDQNHDEYLNRVATAWEFLGDQIVNASIGNTINTIKQSYTDLEASTKTARDALTSYTAAAGEANESLKSNVIVEVTASIAAYTSFIKTAEKARDDLLKQVAEQGSKGATEYQKQELDKLNKFIDDVKAKRDAFIAEAEAKGIVIKIDADGAPALDTFSGLKEEIKRLEETKGTIQLGTAGYDQVSLEIAGLKQLAESLSQSPYEIRIQLSQADLAVLNEQLDLFGAVEQQVKVIGDLEKARFDAQIAYNTYQSQSLDELHNKEKKRETERAQALEDEKAKATERNNLISEGLNNELTNFNTIKDAKLAAYASELQSLKDQGANKDTIALKEEQIKEYTKQANAAIAKQEAEMAAQKKAAQAEEKTKQTEIENQKKEADKAEAIRLEEKKAQEEYIKGLQAEAAVANYGAILEQQKAELISFQGKQKQESLERDILGIKNQQVLAELKAAQIAAERDYQKAINAYKEEYALQEKSGKLNTAKLNDLREEITSIGNIKGLLGEQVITQENLNKKFNEATDIFKKRQEVEAQTFAMSQELQRQQAANAVAQYGILIGEAQKLKNKTTEYSTELAGTIEVNGRVQNIYREVNNEAEKLKGKTGDHNKVLAGTVEVGGELKNVYKEVEGTKVDDPMKRAKEQAELLNQNLGTTQTSIGSIKTDFGAVADNARTATGNSDGLKNNMSNIRADATGTAASMSTFAANIDTANENIGPLKTGVSEMDAKMSSAKTAAQELSTKIETATSKVTIAKDESAQFAGKFSEAKRNTDELSTSIGRLNIQDRLTDPLIDGKDAIDAINESDIKVSFGDAGKGATEMKRGSEGAKDAINAIKNTAFETQFQSASTYAKGMSDQLALAETSTNNIVAAIKSLDGFTATVQVNVVKTNFAGGPIKAGELTQINELGKEAFLSHGGSLKMINKPKNSMWRAPSSGTIIPAHIASNLNIPGTSVKVNRNAAASVHGMSRRDAGSADVARALYGALEASGLASSNQFNAQSQAAQAVQIGKLTHAINKLVDKNWDVKLNIKERNTGFGSHRTINQII